LGDSIDIVQPYGREFDLDYLTEQEHGFLYPECQPRIDKQGQLQIQLTQKLEVGGRDRLEGYARVN